MEWDILEVMKRTLFISVLLQLLLACTNDPDVQDYLAPEITDIHIEALTYDARVSCSITHPENIELAKVILISEDSLQTEVAATLKGGQILADLNQLQSGTSYTLSIIIQNGTYQAESEEVTFTTAQGSKAIYVQDPLFRDYILENCDENQDGIFTQEEARHVTWLDFRTRGITSLEEIRYMSNLQELYICNEQDEPGTLAELDLSGNPRLRRIDAHWNQIRQIDLSHNPKLEFLNLGYNHLEEIDLTGCPELTDVYLDYNDLMEIDLSSQNKLINISVWLNHEIEEIEIPHPELIENLTIGDTRIRDFDLSAMPNLRVYGGNNMNLGSRTQDILDELQRHPKLGEIHICTSGGATQISDPGYYRVFKDLESTNVSGYPLEEIDFSQNEKLNALWIAIAPRLEELDLSQSPYLHLLDISNDENLQRVYVHPDVDIESMEISREGCPAVILHKP